MFNITFRYILILIFTQVICIESTVDYKRRETVEGITDLANEPDDRLLLFSTIDGSLIAIEQQTGKVKWKTKDQPTVKVPVYSKESIVPLFLPDPKDGSLYLLGGDNNIILKKLPFTIPQLVASSPCRSSDGILYTGKKKDTWFMIDPETGTRQKIVGFDKSGPTCPITSAKAIYIGRTQYTIMMADSKKKDRHWNVTFYDYTATSMNKDVLNNFELVHFSASSTGRIITLDRRIGKLLWEKDLGSPVVAIYLLDPEGLISIPFSSLAQDTLTHLSSHFAMHEHPFKTQPAHMQLYPTLYIGEHVHGLYALPSLVDQNVVTISASNSGPLLLDGPGSISDPQHHRIIPLPGMNVRIDPTTDPQTFQSLREKISSIIVLGYYNVPEYSPTRLQISGRIVDFQTADLIVNNKSEEPEKPAQLSVAVQTDPSNNSDESIQQTSNNSGSLLKRSIRKAQMWLNQQENKMLKLTLIILVGCMIAMFWYVRAKLNNIEQASQNSSRSSKPSSTGLYGPITAILEDLPDGVTTKVGKITFMPVHELGKGCDGTVVFRGRFDNRDVAVKRLLPGCQDIADREVTLLRESDEHANVIRYFCMEQDKQFRYIALELCAATLQDYVQGRYDNSLIKPLDILYQATAGLAHLHALDIVHRDIKPQNVLLSMVNVRGEVRAMISDFGLCKKLQVGHSSFSRRSGITGTDGWIAPEMLLKDNRTTCAVDMFSMGCLFYYVLSDGKHPFGEYLTRQANILLGEFHLNELKGEEVQIEVAKILIANLIHKDTNQRPPATFILKYPLFWKNSKILTFFQDVSDRVEKAEFEDPVLMALERHGQPVVRSDWRRHIDPEVAQDLRKYRSYRGESVRDLMRALRNKKHHYRELSAEAQHSLGEIPDKFTNYWTTRFPLLLLHSWLAMQCVRKEATFQQYYHDTYNFIESSYIDTCYSRNIDYTEEYIDEEKDYVDIDKPAEADANLWDKKPKKTFDPRNSSPRKYHNARKHTFQNDAHVRNVEPIEDWRNSPTKRKNDQQGSNSNISQNRPRNKNGNYRGTKKSANEAIVWSIPEDYKKLE